MPAIGNPNFGLPQLEPSTDRPLHHFWPERTREHHKARTGGSSTRLCSPSQDNAKVLLVKAEVEPRPCPSPEPSIPRSIRTAGKASCHQNSLRGSLHLPANHCTQEPRFWRALCSTSPRTFLTSPITGSFSAIRRFNLGTLNVTYRGIVPLLARICIGKHPLVTLESTWWYHTVLLLPHASYVYESDSSCEALLLSQQIETKQTMSSWSSHPGYLAELAEISENCISGPYPEFFESSSPICWRILNKSI